jgi:uncharacterized protein (TIGR03067 family)
MRTTLSVAVLFLISGLSQAGEISGGPGDLGRLQGRWIARAGARHELGVELEVKGQDIRVAITTPQGLAIKVKGGLRLDEAKAPRNLDWVRLLGPDQQPLPEIAAIYKLEGQTFTVCNGGFLGARPSEFKSGDGALADVVVFRRADSMASHAAPPDRSDRARK